MNWIKITEKLSIGSWILPFLLALGGVVSDYVTTTIGLGMGFYETHPQYHPFWAILCFWGALTILTLALPRKKPWTLCVNGLASASYLGFVNNALVILGIFPGIHI
jgi:hypothetical protein